MGLQLPGGGFAEVPDRKRPVARLLPTIFRAAPGYRASARRNEQMRIIGGIAAGLLIKVPKGYDVRPSADLVRQAIFNSLGGKVAGARVLDLFSGSGALGLECLSRGAVSVLSVEKSSRHAAMIRQNLASIHLPAESFELRVQ